LAFTVHRRSQDIGNVQRLAFNVQYSMFDVRRVGGEAARFAFLKSSQFGRFLLLRHETPDGPPNLKRSTLPVARPPSSAKLSGVHISPSTID
jgi:hypothetical protein